MARPRILLVPEFTEVAWTIKPQLEEWAEVASYDPPGVGAEPPSRERSRSIARELVAERGLLELERRGWDRFILVADSWAIAVGCRIAEQRRGQLAGIALGHACLSFRRDGERPPKSAAVWEALTQLLHQDQGAFIRHGIAQATGGSIDEDLADRMLDRFPTELVVDAWEALTADDAQFAHVLLKLDCPMLLAKHEGCLVSTDEGFEDAVAALPNARTFASTDSPESSPAFADELRSFCEHAWAPPPRG
jgi:pimeloyl-ACP methyl ester carboxylesterase